MKTKLNSTQLRKEIMGELFTQLSSHYDEILTVKSNTFSVPMVTDEGDEFYFNLTVSIPTGERGSTVDYDGHAAAEDYKMETELKEQKAKERAKEKARAAERAKAKREAKEKAKKVEV